MQSIKHSYRVFGRVAPLMIVAWTLFAMASQWCIDFWMRYVVFAFDTIQTQAGTVAQQEAFDPEYDPYVAKVLAMAGVVAYGLFRTVANQPFYGRYRQWLTVTPWTHRQPLPLGPIHLVWQDAVALALLTLPLWWTELWQIGAALILFSVVFILGQVRMLYGSDQLNLAWLIGSVLVTSFALPDSYRYYYTAFSLVGAYAILSYGRRVALRGFRVLFCENRRKEKRRVLEPANVFGYPVGPQTKNNWRPRLHYGLLALFVCWAAYCAAAGIQMANAAEREIWGFVGFVVALVAIGLAVTRLETLLHHQPPVSLFMRLRSGQLIHPAYDIAFVVPAVMLAVALVGTFLMSAIRVSPENAVALNLAGLFWLNRVLPPRMESWKLTSSFQMVVKQKGKEKMVGLQESSKNPLGAIGEWLGDKK